MGTTACTAFSVCTPTEVPTVSAQRSSGMGTSILTSGTSHLDGDGEPLERKRGVANEKDLHDTLRRNAVREQQGVGEREEL